MKKSTCCVHTMKNLVIMVLIICCANYCNATNNFNNDKINLLDDPVDCIANHIAHQNTEMVDIDSLKTDCKINNINATRMENLNITLVCRNATSLLIDICLKNNNTINKEINTFLDGNNDYIVKIHQHNNQALIDVMISNNSNIWIHNLAENTTYNILVYILSDDLILYPVNNNLSINTLEKNYKPQPIIQKSITFTNIQANSDNKTLNLLVKWENGPDKICYITFLYHATSFGTGDLNTTYLHYPMSLNEMYLTNLAFATEYAVSIRSCDDNENTDDVKPWIYYKTPSCLEIFDYNLDLCAPEVPSDLNGYADYMADNIYNIIITWKKPIKNPTYYILVLFNIKYNISGDKTSYLLENIYQNVTNIVEVDLYALSIGGVSGSNCFIDLWHVYKTGIAKHIKKIITIGVLIIVLFGLFSIVVYIRKRNAQLERQRDRQNYFAGLDNNDPGDPVPIVFDHEDWLFHINAFQKFVDATIDHQNMEIERNLLQFIETIGQGAFGVVRKAKLTSNDSIVAVKSLKDCPSLEDIREFYDEIQVMKSVPAHPNIVGIIGHCTKNVRELMLLIEYCECGNLQLFLHAIYKHLSKTKIINNNQSMLGDLSDRKLKMQKKKICKLNYDLSIHDKLSIQNKNINANFTGYGFVTGDMSAQNNSRNLEQHEVPLIVNQNIAINKLYDEYNGIDNENERKENCTNTCKNHVKIISNGYINDGGNNSDDGDCKNSINHATIQISNECDCITVSSSSTTTTNNNNILNNNYYNNSYGHFSNNNQINLLVENPCYSIGMINKDKENEEEEEKCNEKNFNLDEICSADLLSFAEQIANGMKFLSLNKVVHRDLAARNILVCSDKTVKICDFGLSRDVYQDNVYTKISNGRLPIRWMAIESLLRSIYTTQSDVWSFGILLFELVTLGVMPYPTVLNNEDLLENLKLGKRMERPVTCSQELYGIMKSCWHHEPEERPKFSDIQLKLQYLLNDIDKEHIIISTGLSGLEELHKKLFNEKNINEQMNNGDLINSNSSYLKPIDF